MAHADKLWNQKGKPALLNNRARVLSALVALVLATLVGFVPFGPTATADPDISDVRAKVEKLYHEAEQAAERHNDAKLELDELASELDSVEADEERQGEELEEARTNVRDAIIRQHQGQGLGEINQLLTADTDAFLTQLSTVATVNQLQDAMLETYNNELDAYEIRREETEKRRKRIAALEEKLAEEKETADAKLAEAKELLAELEVEQRERVISRGETPAPGDLPAASGNAKAAVGYAMAQVGKRYVYGGVGPSSFDCSGLTMRAWGAAGVSLPHSSRAQFGYGRRVSVSQLQPGDLVFYYSPISHVGLYIGNGMIVHAANPSRGVRVDPLRSMPYVGAVRPG